MRERLSVRKRQPTQKHMIITFIVASSSTAVLRKPICTSSRPTGKKKKKKRKLQVSVGSKKETRGDLWISTTKLVENYQGEGVNANEDDD